MNILRAVFYLIAGTLLGAAFIQSLVNKRRIERIIRDCEKLANECSNNHIISA